MKPSAVDPKATTRAAAFELWMDAPNPMVTFFKTLDVTPLVRRSRKRGDRFNMLLCWCIGRAAGEIREFYLLPVGRELLQYDSIAVNTIVKNKNGEVSSCDVPFSEDLAQFNADYLRLTREAAEACENHDLTDSMVIGTSAIVDTEIDGAVGMNSGIFNNPFLIWGRYHRGIFKTTLKLSFQFHHTVTGLFVLGRRIRRGACCRNLFTRCLMPSFVFIPISDVFMLISALAHGKLPHTLFRRQGGAPRRNGRHTV